MSITKSQTEKIGSIFNGNRFIIPTYQRKYSWTDTERKALWQDIEESIKDKMNHFVGTLSFKENKSIGLSTDTVYEIIDGQHRLENAKTLKKPVYFIMLKGYGLRQIQRLNSNMKNWNADDFMEGYCQIGMKDYVLYREFKNKYKFGHNECLAILTGQSKKVNHEFSKGLFKVKNYEESCDTAEKITMYRALYPGFRRRAFVYAMITLLRNPKFDTKEMISKLAYQSTKLVDCTNTKQYLMLLEDIYNFKRKGEPVRFI